MSLDSALAAGRARAEARMTSRATVRRKTATTTAAANGRKVPDWAVVHADLPVRVAGTAANSAPYQSRDIGGAKVEVAARILHLPAATSDLSDGDLVEITSGENVGRVFQIIEAGWQDQSTARRVPVFATQRPEEWS